MRRVPQALRWLFGLFCLAPLVVAPPPVEAGYAPSNFLVSRGTNVDEFTPDGTFVRTLITRQSGVGPLAFGPDGALYVATLDGIVRYDADTGAELGVMTPLQGTIRFGPDGLAYVAQQAANQLLQVDPATGAVLRSFSSMLENPSDVAFRANGNPLVPNAFGSTFGYTITEIDLATGLSSTFSTDYGEPWALTTGPDGRHYAANGKFGQAPVNSVQVVGDSGGPPSLFASNVGDGPNDLAFNGEDLFVVNYYDSSITRLDGATGAILWKVSPYGGVAGASAIAVRPHNVAAVPAPPALISALVGVASAAPWTLRRRRRGSTA